MAGSPSTTNSHCQPRSPKAPSRVSNALEIGPPITPAMAVPVMKSATARARSRAGNHWVR